MKENLTSRKFLITLILIALASAVDILSKNGLSANLKDVIIYLGAVFTGGNIVEHVSGAMKTKFTNSPENSENNSLQVNPELEEMKAELGTITKNNDDLANTVGQIQETIKKLIDAISRK